MSVRDVMEGIAGALTPLTSEVPGLQVYAFLNTNPTPPSLDIYPGDPFQTRYAQGVGRSQLYFTIRGRVSTADTDSGQKLLLRMLDPNDSASVEAALDGLVLPDDARVSVTPDGVSGFREYVQESSSDGRLLGCEWRVTTFLSNGG